VIELRAATADAWTEAVLEDFDSFLQDHASAERKASATALAMMTHYLDRRSLVTVMIELAREELAHFQQVYRLLDARGVPLGRDRKDEYVGALQGQIRRGSDPYFLDRLLVGGVVEARGCERFGMVASALAEPQLASFYETLALSEARHREIFVDLAREYFPSGEVDTRLSELLDFEARLIGTLPVRAALH